MRPVSPVIPNENHPEVIVAEHQDEYQNLPSIPLKDGILTRWELTEEERKLVAETGNIWLEMLTFGRPVTPIMMYAEQPQIVYSQPTEENNDGNNLQSANSAG